MKTGATNKRVRELITMVREGRLIPKPEFQRRLIWTHRDKDRFLDTVLKSLPFPEIYVADGEVDLETGQGAQLLVDGLQRVSTLIQYFDGDPTLKLMSVPPYHALSDDDKRSFLQYEVAVRDLGAATRELIVEVFQRINATKYSLNDIEINNAVFTGVLKIYAARVAEHAFFIGHDVFSPTDFKRMGDLRFALTIIGTYIQGYFNRDDAFEGLLSRYNDEFPQEDAITARLHAAFAFIDECGFEPKSRVWKKADLFTLLVEVDRCLSQTREDLQPSDVVERLGSFYAAVEAASPDAPSVVGIYYKAALQATNDRINRVRRGAIVGGMLEGTPNDEIVARLQDEGLV